MELARCVFDHVPLGAKSCVGPFFKALSSPEFMNLLDYKRAWPEQAWQLNQSASEHGQHSNSHYLHTLIRNCGMIFSDQICPPRWLSPAELFLWHARDWFHCFSFSRNLCMLKCGGCSLQHFQLIWIYGVVVCAISSAFLVLFAL